MTLLYQGSCLCQKVRYTVAPELGEVRFCYCTSCQKASGSAFSANAKVPLKGFRLISGEELLSRYESSPGKWRYFCRECGSPIYVTKDSEPDSVRVRLGSLDFEPELDLTGHIHVREKPGWYRITDHLPQHEGRPPRRDEKS